MGTIAPGWQREPHGQFGGESGAVPCGWLRSTFSFIAKKPPKSVRSIARLCAALPAITDVAGTGVVRERSACASRPAGNLGPSKNSLFHLYFYQIYWL